MAWIYLRPRRVIAPFLLMTLGLTCLSGYSEPDEKNSRDKPVPGAGGDDANPESHRSVSIYALFVDGKFRKVDFMVLHEWS